MKNDISIILNGLNTIYKSPLLENLKRVLVKYQGIDVNDVFSYGQMKSKIWLIDELENLTIDLGTVFILGGWYGSLPAMMFESKLVFDKIRSFDIDPLCADIADTFNRTWVMDDWKFKASTADIHDLDYNETIYNTMRANKTTCELNDKPTMLINTSCEHIDNFSEWVDKIPTGMLVALQSNNFHDGNGHVNCVESLYDFKKQINLSELYFSGTLNLEKYNRFMLIGIK